MKTVNIHDAKTHLSKLIDAAAKGDPFIIAKAGKLMVKVVPIDAPKAPYRREREQAEIAHLGRIRSPPSSRPLTCRRIQLGASRNRSAAASGARSRCGEPSISKPTMNFLIVAERRSGG